MKEFKFRDIIGVTQQLRVKGSMHCLDIHTFAREEEFPTSCGCCRSSTATNHRVQRMTILGADNEALANEWRNRILWAAIAYKPYVEGKEPKKRRMMILINPFGGAGAAAQAWLDAQPLLTVSHIDLEVTETQRANHAYEIVQGLSPTEFDAITTISGDGLIHEVVNGIMRRPDSFKFLETTTIGCIPGGTANGFVKSLLDEGGEEYGVKEAAFLVAKGQKMNVDITQYEGEYEDEKIYSFLGLSWAIIADCDINSEAIRCCGPPRFTIWGVYRTLFVRDYWAKMEFKGFKIENRSDNIPTITPPKRVTGQSASDTARQSEELMI